MSGTLGLLLSLALVAPPASPALPAAAELDPPRAARLARDILANPRFQRAARRPPASGAAADASGRGKASGGGVDAPPAWRGLPVAPAGAAVAAAGVAAQLFVAISLCVVAALLVALLSRIFAGRWRAQQPVAAAAPAPAGMEGGSAGPDLDAADRLAAAGHYGEAVHELLLLAIARLSARAARPPAPSRTSRELVRLLPLQGVSRDAFADLVALVERTLFGGGVAAAGDFQAARGRTLLLLAPAAAGSDTASSDPGGARR